MNRKSLDLKIFELKVFTLKLFRIAVTILLTTVMLCACASHSKSPYKPATNAGFGYTETLLGENYYRVEFKISGSTKKAQDYALLRASELANTQGYDWFIVLKRDTRTDREKTSPLQHVNSRPVITRNCGLLGCRTDVQTLPTLDMDDDMTSTDVTAVIEIKLGKGIRPALENSYDARETNEKLRAQYP
jgi:hypothetical protein